MTLELWQRVKKVFQGVLDLHASEHPLFLDQACADDSELDRRVQAFLASDRNVGEFLPTPAIDLAGDRRAWDSAESLSARRVARWSLIKDLYQQVAVRPVADRPAFLDQVCGDDEAFRPDVGSLLAAQREPGSLLENPVMGGGATEERPLQATSYFQLL